jgi:hypothetical protein
MPRKQSAAGDLVIVESPAKAKTNAQAVGPGFDGPAGGGRVPARDARRSNGDSR